MPSMHNEIIISYKLILATVTEILLIPGSCKLSDYGLEASDGLSLRILETERRDGSQVGSLWWCR